MTLQLLHPEAVPGPGPAPPHPPTPAAEEHVCYCKYPGCKCKVRTYNTICSLCASGDHTPF
ncbi:hypothetical protein Q8F55_000641 [Vanrija albida]|uniref:Uncharacterized protein n=1 Tax=Vanrija albida TaxID=181172 RepID=A0ABR3QEB9_9TREE